MKRKKDISDVSFHCCNCGKDFGLKEGRGLRLGRGTFVGKCPKCKKESGFLSSPSPLKLALKFPRRFGSKMPKECPSCKAKQQRRPGKQRWTIRRYGLNIRCTQCKAISSEARV